MNNFEELLYGHYRNRLQAQSNPAQWPQIDIRIWRTQEGVSESKSWYKYQGEKNAYNWLRYRIRESTETTVKTDIFNVIKKEDSCPFVWTWDGRWWTGIPDGWCQVGKFLVKSRIRFDGLDYRSMDQGWDTETDSQAWGKSEEEGEFLFTLLDK